MSGPEAELFCSFWTIYNTVIHFNLNYCFKMTLIVARWLVDWFGGLNSVFRRAALLLVEREAYLTPPSLIDKWSTHSVGSFQILILTDDSLIGSWCSDFLPQTNQLFKHYSREVKEKHYRNIKYVYLILSYLCLKTIAHANWINLIVSRGGNAPLSNYLLILLRRGVLVNSICKYGNKLISLLNTCNQ